MSRYAFTPTRPSRCSPNLDRCTWLLFAGLLTTACAREAPPQTVADEATLDEAALTITEHEIYDRIATLAADSMRGRDTPSPELDQAAAWIASEFRAMGLSPAFDTDFVQTYAIRRVGPDMMASTATLGTVSLSFGDDVALPFGPTEGRVAGPVTVMSGSSGWQRAVTGEAVSGKHVVWVQGEGENGIRSADARRIARAFRVNGALSILMASDADTRAWERDAQLRAQQTTLLLEGESGGNADLGDP